MGRRILVIGQSPGNKPHIFGKSSNTSIKRLNMWMDSLKVKFFSFSNIIHKYDKKISFKSIDKSAWLCYIDLENTIVIGLGNFVSESLKKLGIDHFKMPHPSGLNRQLNDKEFEISILKECKQYIKEKSRVEEN